MKKEDSVKKTKKLITIGCSQSRPCGAALADPCVMPPQEALTHVYDGNILSL